MLKFFTNAEYSDLYETSLKVIQNWDNIIEKSEIAMRELNQGRCARSGYVFGKLIREIMMSDASLSSVLGLSADLASK